MFWKHEPVVLHRKGKALVVACVVSGLIGLACVILSMRGSLEGTMAALLAVVTATATGNWAHWAFKDADKLAREIGSASSHARAGSASADAERCSAYLPGGRVLPQNRRVAAFSHRSSPRARRRTGSDGKRP
jgi:hypothetical protein